MAVRCAIAEKTRQDPASPIIVPPKSKLVMHVLSDSARASTRHPASLKLLFNVISSFVRAGSLVRMRRSSCTRDFLKRLQRQAFKHEEELASNMAVSAALIWTSAEQLRLGPGNTTEFCSLLNRILRERDGDLLVPACGVVCGINLLCVTRRDASKLRYPPGGRSHRGGGLPAEHLPFFTAGKKFRVPMYLATSFDEEVAYRRELLLSTSHARLTVRGRRFWLMAFDKGEPPVHWIVQVDPRGETSLR
jgi:hypothetical protein